MQSEEQKEKIKEKRKLMTYGTILSKMMYVL
jgi:hypothetical protein